ncbi:GntR family transcriptional regulator [Qipengyuania sp. SM2507]
MSPAHVLEPTYRRLKRALMEGTWPDGAKLEAMRLADDFGVSMTPVRDSLNQLVGEGLVDLTPGEGFRVPVLTEQALRDILEVNAVLLEAAIRGEWRLPGGFDTVASMNGYAHRLAGAFSALARGSGNRLLVDAIDWISERLHTVRLREPQVLPDSRHLLERIEACLHGSRNERRNALDHYHAQCQNQVSRLVNRLPG